MSVFFGCSQQSPAASNTEKNENHNDDQLFTIYVNGNYGFIDKKGEVIIKPELDGVLDGFSEGLSSAEIDKRWGYLNQKNKVVIKPEYDSAKEFSEGLALVSSYGDKWMGICIYR